LKIKSDVNKVIEVELYLMPIDNIIYFLFFLISLKIFNTYTKEPEIFPEFDYSDNKNYNSVVLNDNNNINEEDVITIAIKEEFKSKVGKSEYKSVIDNNPFISIHVTSVEIG